MSFVCDINAAQQWRMSAAWSTAQLGVLSVGFCVTVSLIAGFQKFYLCEGVPLITR